MTIPGKYLLWINCVLFALFGAGFALMPETLSTLLTDSAPATASAMIDMRATYGGVSLGLAFIFAQCARTGATRLGVLGVLAVMGGLATARGIGMLLDGSANRFMDTLLVAEVTMAALAALSLRRGTSSTHRD